MAKFSGTILGGFAKPISLIMVMESKDFHHGRPPSSKCQLTFSWLWVNTTSFSLVLGEGEETKTKNRRNNHSHHLASTDLSLKMNSEICIIVGWDLHFCLSSLVSVSMNAIFDESICTHTHNTEAEESIPPLKSVDPYDNINIIFIYIVSLF